MLAARLFSQSRWWRELLPALGEVFNSPTVVIPARDEEANLPAILKSISAQQSFEGVSLKATVLVVDDGSSDQSVAVAKELGAQVVLAPVLQGGVANPKSAALASVQGLLGGETIIFVDADVCFDSSTALARIALLVRRMPQDLVSVQPFHRPRSLGESFSLFPNLVSLLASGVASLGRERFTSSVAFGPVLGCSRTRYLELGGHGAVLGDALDDVGLGKLFRAGGGQVRVFPGSDVVSFRMYPRGLTDVIPGFTKNVALGALRAPVGPSLATTAWVAGFFYLFAVTTEAFLSPRVSPALGVELAVAYLAYIFQLVLVGRRVGRFSSWAYIFAPLSLAVFGLIVVKSIWAALVKRKVHWKQREIDLRRRR